MVMYRELLGEMVKKSITKKQLAKNIGVSEKTLFNKLNGKTDFTWNEVKKIRKIVSPSSSLEELFQC
jgi:putative transcriptional regulator